MSLEAWIAFTIAAGILLAIPGPTIMLVVGYALGRGRSTAWSTVPGVALGDLVAMTASLVGLGAILATSAMLFTILKWAGAAYLIYLGISLWRAAPMLGAAEPETDRRDQWRMFGHSFAVTALNPKSIVFFIAFLPQFIVMELTFLTLAVANAAIYAILAGTARDTFRRPSVLKAVNRVGGGLLIGAGTLVAATGRNQ